MTQSDQPDAHSATLPPISAGTNILFAPMGSMHCPCTSVKRPPKRKANLDGESYLVSFLLLSMGTLSWYTLLFEGGLKLSGVC